jgi:RNA polymerase sigma-70 factor, ECF subfamily
VRTLSDTPAPRGTPRHTDFEELYRSQFHRIALQITAYVGDTAEAQDLVQEAFTRAVPRWDRISTYDDPAAWVRKVAWNLATSRWRRRHTADAFLRRQRVRHVDGPTPDRIALIAALATLPPKLRKAFVLHYVAELTVAEIARQEDVPEGTVKSWLHRARALVGGYLTDAKEGTTHV